MRIDRLAAGNPGDVRPIGSGISELRIDYGPGYRSTTWKSETDKDIKEAHRIAEDWKAER